MFHFADGLHMAVHSFLIQSTGALFTLYCSRKKKKKDQLCDHTLTTNPITVGTQIKEMEFSPSSSCINLNWFLRWFQKKSIKFIFLLHFYYVAVLLRQSCPCFLIMFLLFLRLLYSGALDFLLTRGEHMFKYFLNWPSFLRRWHVTWSITRIQHKMINRNLVC